ncbi:MAG: protein kinase family protein [Alphaproteobacteria bacterium]|nr:protein kinase family protein [Alphaproteobacteria bacterium]
MKNTEIHLVVLWANARYAQDEIVADIKTHVDIMAAYDVHWSCDCVADNFTRFYGVNLPKNSGKEQECGTSGFLLLVVRDNNPKYEMTETLRGHEYVNINIFSLKQKYRQWTRGGHKVHTTNSVAETNHDSTLLLGLNYEDLKKSLPKKWDGKIKTIHRDITGAHGWTDLHELFYTLNATTDYVVLRGFEDLKQTLNSHEHGDVDIMVKDYDAARWIIGGEKHFPEHRPHYLISVGDKLVYIDLWNINNNYHDKKWDYNIFNTTEYYDSIIRVPSTENYFYMLIYHCLINKQIIASDYYDKIYALFVKLGLHKKYNIKKYTSPFDLYFQLLLDFMKTNGYDFTRPHDMSVYFSNNLCNFDKYKKYLESNFDFTDIHTVYTNSISRAYNMFVSGYDANKNRMFIKIGDIYGIYANEYRMGKILYDMDNVHFIRPMYWRDCADGHFVAYKWTDGDNLYDLLNSNKLSAKEKKVCIDDIYAIFKCLDKSHVVHRDITLNNLIWTNGHLKLIDFQLAVDSSKYKELEFLLRNPGLLCGLGTPEFRKKEFQWDDAYSLTKVLEHITAGKSYGEKYDKIYNEIKSCIGRNVIQCKPKQNGFRVYYKHLTVKLFGFPIYDRHVSTDKHVKIRLFGIRILKFKAK